MSSNTKNKKRDRTKEPNEESSEGEQEDTEGGRTGLTAEQIDQVDLLFSGEIQSNAKVSLPMVKKTMCESFQSMEHIQDQTTVNRVYDRIRYMQKKTYKKTLAAIETVTRDTAVSDWISEHHTSVEIASSGRSTRQCWDAEDEKAVGDAFKSFEEHPSKKEIRLD